MGHRWRSPTALIGAAAGAAILAACTGPAYPATTAPATGAGVSVPSTASAPAPRPAPGAPVATTAVAIQNYAFSPATLTVKTGTTLNWTNQDQDAHTVTSTTGAFASPTLNTGQSFPHTFATPGRFDYRCPIHPFMTATLVVTP